MRDNATNTLASYAKVSLLCRDILEKQLEEKIDDERKWRIQFCLDEAYAKEKRQIKILYLENIVSPDTSPFVTKLLPDKNVKSQFYGKFTHCHPDLKKLDKFPESADEIAEYDIIILGKIKSDSLTEKFAKALADYGANGNGGIIFKSGLQDSFDLFSSLLPFKVNKPDLTKQRGKLSVPKEAAKNNIAKTVDEKNLPEGITDFECEIPKIVLDKNATVISCLNDDQKMPVFILCEKLSARIFFSFTDETWKLRHKGSAAFENLWNEVFYWASEKRFPKFVLFTQSQNHKLGSTVKIYCIGKNYNQDKLEGTLIHPDGKESKVTFKRNGDFLISECKFTTKGSHIFKVHDLTETINVN